MMEHQQVYKYKLSLQPPGVKTMRKHRDRVETECAAQCKNSFRLIPFSDLNLSIKAATNMMRLQPQKVICTLAAIVLTPFVWILLFTGSGEILLV